MDQPISDRRSRLPTVALGGGTKTAFWTARRAALLLGMLLVCVGATSIVRGAGAFLIVEDPLEQAAAIVSLGGKLPFREIEAAKLYRQGWAPRVIIVRTAPSAEQIALESLQVQKKQEWELSGEVLRQQGVPASAIVVPAEEGIGTLEELQAVYAALPDEAARVILVTSSYHTRRTRLTWQYVTGGRSQPIVRAAYRDRFDSDRWWHERKFILAVVREYLGLLNYYAGFPVTS